MAPEMRNAIVGIFGYWAVIGWWTAFLIWGGRAMLRFDEPDAAPEHELVDLICLGYVVAAPLAALIVAVVLFVKSGPAFTAFFAGLLIGVFGPLVLIGASAWLPLDSPWGWSVRAGMVIFAPPALALWWGRGRREGASPDESLRALS